MSDRMPRGNPGLVPAERPWESVISRVRHLVGQRPQLSGKQLLRGPGFVLVLLLVAATDPFPQAQHQGGGVGVPEMS